MSKKNNDKKYKWSFSRLGVVRQCLHQFDLKYNQKLPEKDNVWGVIGTLIHDICETFLTSKMTKQDSFEAVRKWDMDYPWDFKFFDGDLRHQYYYKNIRAFIKNVLPTLSGKVVSVEEYFEVGVDEDNAIVGYIDLIIEAPRGGINVIDWKISKRKSFNVKEKQRQLYIYAKHIREKYGKNPEMMYFYLVCENDFIRIPYSKHSENETWEWVKETIEIADKAKDKGEYPANPNYFFCKNLCGQRDNCTQKTQ